mmetsp:Transcript_23947/g.31803  ORF Transcript_23947/g.31803 Transcript_23947/m.31803 type:complete len:201 (-) Transcript_23947:370-972(-)
MKALRLHCFHTSLLLCFFFTTLFVVIIIVVIVPTTCSTFKLQSIQIRLQLITLNQSEFLIFPYNCNTTVILCQFYITTHTASQSSQRMHDQIISRSIIQSFVVFFEISPPTLTPSTNSRCIVFIQIPRWTGLVQMRTILIIGRNKQSYTVWTSDVRLCGALVFIGKVCEQPSTWHGCSVHVFMVETFVSHPLGNCSCVGG